MRFLLSIFFFFAISPLIAGNISIEEFFHFDESEEESTEYTEILSQLTQKPLNLKTATKSDLEILFWLSDEQFNNLYSLIQSGNISYRNLKNFDFSDADIDLLKELTTIREPLQLDFSQRIRTIYQERNQDEPSSAAFYQRILGSFQNIDYCLLTEKDATEKEFANFYSYFLSYQSDNLLQKAIIGRYRLAFGQGLLMASKLGLSKGSATTTIPAKHHLTVRGYTSSYEIWFLEGGAAQINKGNFSLVPFYSKAKYAASLREGKISSFNESGIYKPCQTYTHETLFGSYLRWQANKLALGTTMLSNQFAHPFLNDKRAQSYTAVAADWHYSSGYLRFGGEIANADDKTAFVSFFRWGDRAVRHLLLVRSYPANFPIWHGNPFSSQSAFDNEQGVYYGLETRIWRFKINAFFDVWRFPKTRYYEKMPTVASEEFIQIETKTKQQKWTLSVNHKFKEKYKSLDNESIIRNFQRTVLRTDWWHYFEVISLRTRFEYASEYYQDEKLFEKGILVSQLVRTDISNFHITAQIAMYHSDVLHYLYEYSMDGQMESSVLSGDGFFSYLLIKYAWKHNLKVQFKISDRWNQRNYQKLAMQLEYVL